MIYLDYASATPVDKDVLDCYVNVTNNYYGNPNSNHDMGKMAKKVIDEANIKIANILKVNQDEIIYTSGATESNNLAILGASYRYKNFGNHILVSSLEHNSVMSSSLRLQEEGFEVEIIPVNKDGIVDIDVLKSMIRPTTILVSVTSVDSELGIKQPIEEIGKFLKNYDHIVFHTDASQAIGKINIDIQNADLVTIAPHKFYGLMGISILVKRKNIELKPQILGGKSTTVYRSGTPNTNLIASTAVAIEKAYKNLDERYKYVKELHDYLINLLKQNKDVIINSTANSLPYTINISVKKVKSVLFVDKLNQNGVMVSSKTSCCPIMTPSKLVYALTKDKGRASSSIRISLSYLTTKEEIDEFINIFNKVYEEVKNGEV